MDSTGNRRILNEFRIQPKLLDEISSYRFDINQECVSNVIVNTSEGPFVFRFNIRKLLSVDPIFYFRTTNHFFFYEFNCSTFHQI